jgi:ribosomal protein L21
LKKLLKLKDWLTVPDAARHLSILFGEDVSEADVLRFALDGHLTLSVDFVNVAAAQCGKIIPLRDAKIKIIQTSEGKSYRSINGIRRNDVNVISFDGELTFIEGVWDLAMHGAERKAIEHKYRLLTDGPAVDLGQEDGILVNRPDGTWAQLLRTFDDSSEFHLWNFISNKTYDRPDNWYAAQTFPSDAVLVVRTSALRDLEALISEPEPDLERPIERRERRSLLVIIAALAKLAKVNVAKPSAAAAAIEGEAARMGIRVGVRTIEEKLKLIPDVLASKADT